MNPIAPSHRSCAPSALPFSRRTLLRYLLGAGAAASWSGCSSSRPVAGHRGFDRPASDLIRRENERPGTPDWLLAHTRIDPATRYRCPWIEGFCSHTSLLAGETLDICVDTNPPSPFRIDVYRLG